MALSLTYEAPRPYVAAQPSSFLRTIFVSPTGGGNGVTAPVAFNNLPTVLRPGDLALMLPGPYPFTQPVVVDTVANEVHPAVIQPLIYGTVAIDGGTVAPGTDYQIRVTGEFVEFNGIEIKNMPSKGIMIIGNHNTVKKAWIHHCNATGFHIMNPNDNNVMTGQSYNALVDSLIHHCSDANLAPAGENADGAAASIGIWNSFLRNIFHTNSDDGLDVWQSLHTIIDSCLSYDNGYGLNGDGNGYKLGNPNAVGNKIYNSIASNNKTRGFDGNDSPDTEFVRCLAFKQPTPFKTLPTNVVSECMIDGAPFNNV